MTNPTPFLRLAPLAAVFVLGIGPVTAQDTSSDTAEPAVEATAPAADAPTMAMDGLTADTVIATVGEYDLTLGELIAVRQALPEQYQQLSPIVLTDGLTQQLINQTILAERARETGLDEAPEVALRLKNIVSSTLADAYLRAGIETRINEESIAAAYAAQYGAAEPVEEVRAAHILVDSQDRAQDIRDQIEAGGDFAALAAEHGTDGTASRGGDLGYFTKEDMVPEFADAAFALEVGALSEPVESPFGWHLIRVDDRRARPVPPIEEVRDQIVSSLADTAQAEIIAEAVNAVEVTRPDLALPPEAILADDLIASPPAE